MRVFTCSWSGFQYEAADAWRPDAREIIRRCPQYDRQLLRAVPAAVRFITAEPLLGPLDTLDLAAIDRVIAGGESGPRHRPLRLDHARELRDWCVRAGVPFFFKQHGGHRPGSGGRPLDCRTWDKTPAADAH